MATFVIKRPDGQTVRITAAPGTTKQQALSRYKAAYESGQRAKSETYDPASGMSGAGKFMAGAGKAVVDIGRGLRQIGAEAGNLAGVVSDETVAGLRREQDATAARDAPLMATGAGLAGNIAGNIGTIYATGGALQAPSMLGRAQGVASVGRALSAPATYAQAGAVGAGLGALQPVGENGSRATNTSVGAGLGILGQSLASLAGRIAKPVKGNLNAADQRAVSTLEQAGVPLDAAQKSGSPVLTRVKSALKDNPVTLTAQTQQFEAQNKAFTGAVLRSIGATSGQADEATMGAAKSRISQMFNDVLERNSIQQTPTLIQRMEQVAARSRRMLPGDNNQITRTIDDLAQHAKANGGKIDGRFYNNLRGDIAALESEKGVAPIARELREALDDAFQRGAQQGDAQTLQEARRLWRNMRIIENAIDNEGAGLISPAKLANQFGKQKNRAVGVYGQGDKSILELAKLAKAGKRLIPDKLPNSGTVPRALAQAALPAAAGAVYGGMKEGDLSGAVTYGLGAAAIPYALQRGINNPATANYLASGLGPGQAQNALRAIQGAGVTRLLPIATTPAIVAK